MTLDAMQTPACERSAAMRTTGERLAPLVTIELDTLEMRKVQEARARSPQAALIVTALTHDRSLRQRIDVIASATGGRIDPTENARIFRAGSTKTRAHR